MVNSDQKKIAIVGAGLAGPLLACFLARDGHDVTLYERRSDPRVASAEGGRSINLALSARGINALSRVGLAEQVLASAIPMRGRMLHEPSGKLAFQYYSANHTDAINSVSRAGLNAILVKAASNFPNVRMFFDYRCTSADLDRDRPTITFDNGRTVETDLIVGADGAYSAVRQAMQKREGFDYSQTYERYGYKELTIPPTPSGEFAMEPNALHIWPRKRFMMIALPNQDRSFTCTCFWPFTTFEALQSRQKIEQYFRENFADSVHLMPALVQDFQRNPVGSLVTIRCFPWHFQNRAVLLGDAAHAIVPFYGQGMNAAFEDCLTLSECLRHSSTNPLQAYGEIRKPNADAIADMALENFVEMRDRVASRAFLLKKKFDHLMHRLFPRSFASLYEMVSFSTIPYAQARRRARRQSQILHIAACGFALLLVLIGILLLRYVRWRI